MRILDPGLCRHSVIKDQHPPPPPPLRVTAAAVASHRLLGLPEKKIKLENY